MGSGEFLMIQAWTGAPSVPSALVSMLLKLPKLKFVIVTLGEDGCIMLEKSENGKYLNFVCCFPLFVVNICGCGLKS